MKRDMDLVRQIMLDVEKEAAPPSSSLLKTDRDGDVVDEHLKLLIDEAGLLSGIPGHTMQGRFWLQLRLTWRGHEYLDAIRDPEVWAKTKEDAAKIGDFSLDLLKALAKGYVKEKAKRLTGIDVEL